VLPPLKRPVALSPHVLVSGSMVEIVTDAWVPGPGKPRVVTPIDGFTI
jgi:hypothetical protein